MTAGQFITAICWIGALSIYAGSVIFLLSQPNQPQHDEQQEDQRSQRGRY
ncbi:hypothetical protein HFK83_03125 [Ralstonia pseudosolanacearum]|nr:hypothetical protein [Ralstonia pseudosolanacearum]MCK4121363.1 hypothetical protein [Ralstonia pseudosolanacearum]